jgi:hypothetical protein
MKFSMIHLRRRGHLRGEKTKNPKLLSEPGVHQLWRCPTLAQPLDALPSGLQRFTSVFGMGTGGSTALGSPEGW